MAEYFPLLERAVSGLPDQTAEARRSIYERARTALLGQLRGMDPPIPDEDIARENTALDDAILRLERQFAERRPQPTAVPVAPPPPVAAAAAPLVAKPGPTVSAAAPAPDPHQIVRPARLQSEAAERRPAAPTRAPAAPAAPKPAGPPSLPTGRAPPVIPPPTRERPTIGPRPDPTVPAEGRGAPAPRSAPGKAPNGLPAAGVLPPSRGTRPVMALRPAVQRPADAPQPGPDDAGPPSAEPAADEPAATVDPVTASAADVATVPDPAAEAPDTPAVADDAREIADRPREAAPIAMPGRETSRPAAPRPRPASRFTWPVLGAIAAVVVLMIGVGIAAWAMRDRPDKLAVSRTASTPTEDNSTGKIGDRAASATGSTDTPAGDAPSSGISVPPPEPQNNASSDATPAIAVAQRAALLIDAPDDPQRVKTYTGTVVWHIDSVSPGQGQPLATAVKADINIPDAKLAVTMLLQRNPEPQLPASHTMELHFSPAPGSALGGVKQINVPEMRKDDDAATGDPLSGVPVAITDNYFLVGLSRGAAESQNLRLISERNWFDVSLLSTSGKLAKLTFEKGAAGQRVLEDAMKSWR